MIQNINPFLRIKFIGNYTNRLHWVQFNLFPRRGHVRQAVGTDTAYTTVEFSSKRGSETRGRNSETSNWFCRSD